MRYTYDKTKPIPLVFILEEMNYGGTQKSVIELAKRINRELFSPEIWIAWAGDTLIPQAEAANIPVSILCQYKQLRPFASAYAICKHLNQVRPPLIHLCTVFPNISGRLFGRLVRTPIIIGGCKGQINIRLQYERFLWPLAHNHICDALSIKEELENLGVAHERVHFISNGVDADFFTPAKCLVNNPEILCVARLVMEKDHATLLQAFSLVHKQIPKARLHLVGDGPLRGKIQKLSNNLGLDQNIIFHGSSAKVREHMQKARLLVLSSISEGTPNALLEGMACGLPIVSTSIAGVPQMLEHGKQGLLVKTHNPEELAEAMLKILKNDKLAQDMGQAGRKHVCSNYSLEKVARDHEDIYLKLCKERLFPKLN